MELTKKALIEAGLTEDQANKVIQAHTDTLKDKYVPIHRFNEVNTDLTNTKEALKERDTQIKDLKKFEGDATQLQTKIAELEKENKTKDDTFKQQIGEERKRNAVKFALLEDANGKPHDLEMVMGLFALDQVTIDESGKIQAGFAEQVQRLRKEKSFLFETKQQNQQIETKPTGWTPTGTPPASGSEQTTTTQEAASYGKSLAAVKLGMMGIQPTKNENQN